MLFGTRQEANVAVKAEYESRVSRLASRGSFLLGFALALGPAVGANSLFKQIGRDWHRSQIGRD